MVGCVNTPDVSRVVIDHNMPQVKNLKSLSGITQIGLEWKPIYDEQIKGYYIYRGQEGKGQLQRIATIEDRYASHYLDEKLKPQTVYKYKMSALSSNGKESVPSNAISVSTKPLPEPVPFVQAITDLPNRIKIIWRPHPFVGVVSYVIQRKKPTDKKWSNHEEVEGRLSAEYIDSDLSDNKAYQYRVLAKTESGVLSKPSKAVGAVTKQLPKPVTNVRASKNEPKKIVLTWNPSASQDIAYYKIYSSPTPYLLFSYLARTKDTKFEDLVDVNGRKKYYKITAVDIDELESLKQDEPISGQTLPAPNAPVVISASYQADGVHIRWNASNDVDVQGYEISKEVNGNKEVIGNIKGESFVDSNLMPNEKYRYRVYAVDKYGLRSKSSNDVIISTKSEMN